MIGIIGEDYKGRKDPDPQGKKVSSFLASCMNHYKVATVEQLLHHKRRNGDNLPNGTYLVSWYLGSWYSVGMNDHSWFFVLIELLRH